jgi:trigger factor
MEAIVGKLHGKDEQTLDVLNYKLPEPDQMDMKDGEDFNVSIEFEVAPEFKLPDYSKLKVDLKEEDVKDEEISSQMDRLKHNYGKYTDCEGPVIENDMLEVAISSDITLPENASDEAKRLSNCDNMWVWVRDPEMIPGLNKAVIGAKLGASVKFVAEYPADFRETALAGKKTDYSATVTKIQRHSPIEDMDELCKRLKAANLDELKDRIRKEIENAKTSSHEYMLKEKYIEEICEKTPDFPLPEKILNQFVADETNAYVREHVENEAQAEDFQKNKDEHMKKIRSMAEAKLRRFLILRKIANTEKISVENEDIERELTRISRYYGMDRKALEKNYSERLAEHMHMQIIEDKVKTLLADRNSPAKESNKQ